MIFKAKTKNEIILIPKKPIKGLRYLKFICELPNLYGKILGNIFSIQIHAKIKIKNFWVVRQFNNEYNPIHYHEGDLSGVGYLKIPKHMTKNKNVKNKKIKTNGTIDFINGQKAFLSKSIFNLIPKTGDLLIFPNYLMHTAYPFNIEEERRSLINNLQNLIILYKSNCRFDPIAGINC